MRRERVAVEPRDFRREIVWIRLDGREVMAGSLPARTRAVDLLAPAALAGSIAVDDERWPVDVMVRLRSLATPAGDRAWTVSGAATEFNLSVAGVAAGDYELVVSADHHAPYAAPVRIAERVTKLDRIALRRFPTVSGQIVARATGDRVAGARILPEDEVETTSDSAGQFELEISGDWPDHLRVVHESYAMAIVPLPKIAADVFVGELALSAGATLRLSVRPPPETKAVVELSKIDGDEPRRVASREVQSDPLVFSGLAVGSYRVVVRGESPLERYGQTFEVKSAGTEIPLEIAIEPQDMEIVVTRKGVGVPQATVELDSGDGGWRATFTTGEDGKYRTRVWQRGKFVAFVSSPGGAGTVVHADIGEQHLWEIALPDHRIAGTVTDAKSGRGVANATIFLKTDTADTSTLLRSATDESGRFEYSAVEPGKQTITAEAPGYVSRNVSFTIEPQEGDRTITVQLARAVKKTLRVLSPNGAPAVGALVATERDAPSMPLLTDATGRAEIAIGQGAAQMVYVAPREGSFAAVRVTPDDAETVVTVPAGEAIIIVRTQDQTMKAVPNVWLDFSYNGHLIPSSVLSDIARHQGRELRTGNDGRLVLDHMPLGLYEIRRASSADAPARIAVQPGANSVILTFARRAGSG
ncbi:MAG TPA: carboxypeptidase-like regulatory domain-containing protein [Thermoanaerobaculia bacterium]